MVKTSIHRLVDHSQVEPNKKKNSILACQAQEGNDDNEEEAEHYVAVTEETLSVIGQSTIIRVMNSCDTAIVPCERGTISSMVQPDLQHVSPQCSPEEKLIKLIICKELI